MGGEAREGVGGGGGDDGASPNLGPAKSSSAGASRQTLILASLDARRFIAHGVFRGILKKVEIFPICGRTRKALAMLSPVAAKEGGEGGERGLLMEWGEGASFEVCFKFA